jgi:transposase-like protein
MIDHPSEIKIESPLLGVIAERYAEYRNGGESVRKRYPPELRKLAVSAFKNGCSAVEVSQAAGVSTHTIYAWRAQLQGAVERLLAKELKVVPEPVSRAECREWATIRLRSGVGIEVPFSALTSELLMLLSEVRA